MVDHLCAALEPELGAPIRLTEPADVGSGFSADITAERGAVHWQGVVGCDLDEDRRPWLSAVLFPFICGRRVTPGPGSDFVYFRFVVEAGVAQWLNDGWKADEFEEYGYWLDYREAKFVPNHDR